MSAERPDDDAPVDGDHDARHCVRLHAERKPAEFDVPADLCERCWWEWWCEGWES